MVRRLPYRGGVRFTAVVLPGGKAATGLPVPDEVLSELGGGRRPAVTVTLAGHTYRTTVGSSDGRPMLPLSAEHRTAAGVAAGDEVEVEVALDVLPREVAVPDDLRDALAAAPAARSCYEALAPGLRKEWVRWVEEAKKAETRAARVARAVERLSAGEKRH